MTAATVDLLYDAMGDRAAPPLMLLHGFPLSRAAWMPVLPTLARSLRGIAPDLRGHGASPAPDAPGSMDLLARDVLALADRLQLRTFDLAAHSMGGYVAFALLRLAPDRVRRLALVATRATSDSEEARRGRVKQADMVQLDGVRALASLLVPKLVAPRAPEVVQEEARRIVEGTGVTGIVRSLEAMAARPDATDLLPRIRQPTLVVAGAEDQVMPRAEVDRLARDIPGARLETIEGCGHLPMLERPRELAEALLKHFEG